jgi:hypothetical protein
MRHLLVALALVCFVSVGTAFAAPAQYDGMLMTNCDEDTVTFTLLFGGDFAYEVRSELGALEVSVSSVAGVPTSQVPVEFVNVREVAVTSAGTAAKFRFAYRPYERPVSYQVGKCAVGLQVSFMPSRAATPWHPMFLPETGRAPRSGASADTASFTDIPVGEE